MSLARAVRRSFRGPSLPPSTGGDYLREMAPKRSFASMALLGRLFSRAWKFWFHWWGHPTRELLAVLWQLFPPLGQVVYMGRTPHYVPVVFSFRLQLMKTNSTKKVPTLGEFITRVYDAGDERKASGIVRLAVAAHLIEFRGRRHVVAS